jgi:hypothetical protein
MAKTLGGSNVDDAQSIRQTSMEDILLPDPPYPVTEYCGNHGNYDYWIVKLDSNGNMQWQKSLGGSSMDIRNLFSNF